MTHIYVNKLRHKGLTEEFDFIVAGMECIRIDLKKKKSIFSLSSLFDIFTFLQFI